MAVMGKAAAMRQFSRHRRPQGQTPRGQGVRFWGRHAVLAALANPDRRVKRIWGTREALGQLDLPPVVPISFADVADLARLVARDAPHQGLVMDRHSPPESGVIARSASGALETVPWVRVVNLSRALEEIAEAQYWRIGLTGDTETTLGDTLDGSKVALVLGSEGDGMRHNVMEHCDVLAKLPISPRMESLNISNAAAIALYAVATAGA